MIGSVIYSGSLPQFQPLVTASQQTLEAAGKSTVFFWTSLLLAQIRLFFSKNSAYSGVLQLD